MRPLLPNQHELEYTAAAAATTTNNNIDRPTYADSHLADTATMAGAAADKAASTADHNYSQISSLAQSSGTYQI